MQNVTRPSGLRATLRYWSAVQMWVEHSQVARLHLIGHVRGHDRLGGIIITSSVTRLFRLRSGRFVGAMTRSQGRLYRLIDGPHELDFEYAPTLGLALRTWGVKQEDWKVADYEVLAKIAGAAGRGD
jgi:hypothetical protein